jgi:hypothetical protein
MGFPFQVATLCCKSEALMSEHLKYVTDHLPKYHEVKTSTGREC